MINSPHEHLSEHSHQLVESSCDFKISPKCRKSWIGQYRDAKITLNNNNNKIICVYCSKQIKYTGRSNPNCKYKNLDDNFFKNIDSLDKAYVLGWIAGDGHLGSNHVSISIRKKDVLTLEGIRDIICKNIPIKECGLDVDLNICSKTIMLDICNHLKIKPGKKSYIVQFPDLDNDDLKWSFLQGYFEADGTVNTPGYKQRVPKCSIASSSPLMLSAIQKFVPSKSYITCNSIQWDRVNALDFLGKIYENSNVVLKRKFDLFRDWCSWSPSLSGGGKLNGVFKWSRTTKNAKPPFKVRVSDSGYDLTLIEKIGSDGIVDYYNTGIKVTPEFGWFFMLSPRSSISKSGYMLANSIGIIDRSYVGEIIVPLIKIDKTKPDLELPARVIQIIPIPIIHFEIVEVDELDDTERGTSGFGSTGAF